MTEIVNLCCSFLFSKIKNIFEICTLMILTMSGTLLVFSIFKISVYECSVWLLRNDTGKKKKTEKWQFWNLLVGCGWSRYIVTFQVFYYVLWTFLKISQLSNIAFMAITGLQHSKNFLRMGLRTYCNYSFTHQSHRLLLLLLLLLVGLLTKIPCRLWHFFYVSHFDLNLKM